MKRVIPAVLAVSFGLLAIPARVAAQSDGGDQFLDGIGETALVARYMFNGTTADRSRNAFQATLNGSGSSYVEDKQFGKVLSLPGKSSDYLQIPSEALDGLDAASVTGWIFLNAADPGQRFFDFGPGANANAFCSVAGASANDGYHAGITASGKAAEKGPSSANVPTGRWAHLAVVLGAARHTLSTYLDGARVGQVSVSLNLEQVLNQDDAAANRLFIGKSQQDADPGLNAKLHDVRVYSIALNDQQVGTIYKNGLTGEKTIVKTNPVKNETNGPASGSATSGAIKPLGILNVTAETVVGTLPRLPRTVPGVYAAGAYPAGVKGPDLPVIWPSPRNNQQVLQAGTYMVTGHVAGTTLQPKATITVKAAAAEKAAPQRTLETFPLGRVVLNQDEQQRDSQFIKNRDKFIQGLAKSNPDRFLYMFRDAFGQPQPAGAEPLGGWDNQTTRLRGHASGHYLSAIAQAYASTGYDPALQANFLQKMNYLIDTLYDLSQKSGKPAQAGGPSNADPTKVPPGPGKADYDSDLSTGGIRTDYWNWGTGFISAYPPDQFIMLEHGATYGGGNNQIWAPYYTLHKILAGLLDCYEVGGNKKALEIAQGMGLWVQQRLQVVPAATRISMWNRYIAGEYGGMNEVLARLSRITGDKRFLECARLFDNIEFFYGDAQHTHGLAKNVDTLRGRHANQHLPQITGALETYRNTNDRTYWDIACNFWNICTECYQYSIGGVAGARNPNNAECFTAEPDSLFVNGFATGGQNETCATYNLLKLSRQLFLYQQDPRYMDYYEKALYNDILASVAENNAGNTYHIPLNPASRKGFGNANMGGFTCCNGTALESSTKLQDSIYFRSADNEALYVNLYVPSTLNWTEKKVTVIQRTSFPREDTTRLVIAGKGFFALNVRVPHWAQQGFFVKINGQEQKVEAKPGTYLTLRRAWKDKDIIELRMPFAFHLERVMDQPNIASLFYGPVLLAAEEPEPRSDWRPITLDAADLGKSITGDPAALRFQAGDAAFRPFYETYGRYSVYLNVTLK